MTSLSNFPLLSAITLGTFAWFTSADPLAHLDRPSGEPPGRVLEAEGLLCDSPVWGVFIASTTRHKKQFEDEFSSEANYDFLERTEIPSPPAGCPVTINKEACLLRLVQGLQVYKVLLTHVKKEYPDNALLQDISYNSDLLIHLIKEKMRHPERLAVLSDTEAQSILQGLENTNTFQSKLTAHSILRKLHLFLIDSSRDLSRKERGGSIIRGHRVAHKSTAQSNQSHKT